MKRSHLLLSVLAVVLVVAMFTMLLYRPKRQELAEVQAAIQVEQDLQTQLRGDIERLKAVRDEAPQVEAELAAAEAIVPRDAALPAALRQLQVAADDSGAVLRSVTTARPAPVDGAGAGLSSIVVDVQLAGSYFQVVDFLRRVEDPAISPRGVRWTTASLVRDEYPLLVTTVTGQLFAALPVAAPPAPAEPAAPEGAAPEGQDAAGPDDPNDPQEPADTAPTEATDPATAPDATQEDAT